MEVSVVKRENMQKNFVEKLTSLRKLLALRFPRLDLHNLDKIMIKFAHYHNNKKKFFVVGESKEVYNFLIEKGYNPYTIYRWLLLERVPEDIKFQIKEKQQDKADKEKTLEERQKSQQEIYHTERAEVFERIKEANRDAVRELKPLQQAYALLAKSTKLLPRKTFPRDCAF
jgi:hypothetical protein